MKSILSNVKTEESELDKIREAYPAVRILHFDKDPGAADEHNIGAKFASKLAKYFLFMDNDAEITPNTLSLLVDFMELNPKCGCARGEINKSGASYYVPIFNIMRQPFSIKHPCPIPILLGCCYIARRTAYFQSQGYDKHFFIYGDDSDFSWRLWMTAYTIMFVPEVKMFHNSGGTMKMSPKTQYFLSKNYLVTIFKDLKFPAILITFPLECLLYLFMGMVKIVLRQRPLGLARIYALFYLIINRKLFLTKRIQIQRYLHKKTTPFFDSLIFSPNRTIKNIALKIMHRDF